MLTRVRRCLKELNQWDSLFEYAQSKTSTQTQLLFESAWRISKWNALKDAPQALYLLSLNSELSPHLARYSYSPII